MCILQKLIYGCSWSIIITVAPGTSFIIVRKRLSLHFEQTIKASWDVYRELIQKTHCCTAKLSSFITFSFFAFFCHCLDWAKNKNIMSALGKHGLAWRGHIMLIFWFILLFGAPCRIGLQTWIFKKKNIIFLICCIAAGSLLTLSWTLHLNYGVRHPALLDVRDVANQRQRRAELSRAR